MTAVPEAMTHGIIDLPAHDRNYDQVRHNAVQHAHSAIRTDNLAVRMQMHYCCIYEIHQKSSESLREILG